MSKCRETFEAECERLGLRTEKHWYDCGSRMKFVYQEEMYPLFEAAWNARGKVDAEICREQSKEPECPERALYCAEAIEQENNHD